jgi:hypothetical protein
MRRIVFALVAVGALAGAVATMAPASGQSDGEAAPIFGGKIPPGYRDWRSRLLLNRERNAAPIQGGGERRLEQIDQPVRVRRELGCLRMRLGAVEHIRDRQHPGSEPPLPTRGRTRRAQNKLHLWKRKFSARDFRPHSTANGRQSAKCLP